jgi:glyoxylase-like metal-dependent hydrolase (beta-lactamase superfamily II)
MEPAMRKSFIGSMITVAAIVVLSMNLWGQQAPAGQLLRTIPIQGNIYMVPGAGANVAVSIGRDGILFVDSGTEQAADRLLSTVQQLARDLVARPRPYMQCVGIDCQKNAWGWSSTTYNEITQTPQPPKPIRYIINTSGHPDHTGGNVKISLAGVTYTGGNVTGNILDSGVGAAIVARDTVLARMQEERKHNDALPTDTYATPYYKLSWFFNGEGVQLFPMPNAHSNGDSFVWFRYSDVIVTGEVYNTETYPIIDVAKGGTINGVIDGLAHILDIAYAEFRAQGGTQIIPARGRISDVGDVTNYRNMLFIIRDRVKDLKDKGRTLDQVKAAKPSADYDGRWGATSGPWTTDMFIEAVYRTVQ